MKQYIKYLCAVLLAIGTNAHAWATTETLDFAQCWGIGTSAYENGTYSFGGYAIEGNSVKYNTYSPEHLMLNYYRENDGQRVAWGSVILPHFSGVISSILVSTPSNSGSGTRTIQLYVNGVLQATSSGIAASSSYTFTSLSIAANSTVELRNSTTDNEFHLASIVITHNGSQLGQATPADGTIAIVVDGCGTVSASNNPVAHDATSTLTATPASGWAFDYWEITTTQGLCENWQFEQDEFYVGNVSPNNTSATTVTLTNNTYASVFKVVAHFVETTCTKTPTITFTTSGTIEKKVGAAIFTNAATVKFSGSATGQTITYSSSNESIAIVDDNTGEVLVADDAVGSATITASVAESGDYCAQSASYTINVTGYNVTYHFPTCATNKPTNKKNYFGSLTLPTGLAVDGYQFVGWTTNGSYSNGATPPTLQGASITVSANVDLYAVWRKVSSKFVKCDKNTAITEGDYVFCTNYTGTAVVMTNTLDNNKRMTTDGSSYTFDGDGNLSCNEEDYIWHISGSTGNWVVYNASSGKYLSANNGTTGSTDRQMRLADNSSTNYEKWIIAQKDASTVPYQIRNKGRVAANAGDYGINVNSGKIGWLNNATGSFYLFKRTSTVNAYTINPDCDAAEYTVTFSLSTAPAGTIVSASATGATFSSPVLAPVLAGATVSINVTTVPTGYTFTRWEVSSGGASLTSSATVAGNGFEMPGANVVLTPVFTPIDYTITYKDKGGSAFSGAETPSPTVHTYGTETTLPTEFTKTVGGVDYVFMGWYDDSGCTEGHQITSVSATTQDITVYALWVHFEDPLAWCPEPEMTITGTTYITSMYHADNGGMVRGSAQLTVNARNMGINESITLTSDNSDVYFSLLNTDNIKRTAADKKPKTSITLTTDANGKLNGDEGQTVYVHYMPSAWGDGSISDVTVTATYAVPDPDVVRTGHVYVRSMPAQFVMAAKVGDKWYALPNNVTEASNPQPLLIDVNETTWRASAPATAGFAMWPVETTNSDVAAYTEKGAWLRFAGNEGKALWANNSASGYTIKIDASNNPMNNLYVTGDAYMWEVTTTPQNALDPTAGTWIYNLQNHQTNNGNYLNIKTADVVWGTYNAANQLTKDIYLLPLDVVTPANMTVMEWAPTEIALKCADNTVLTGVTIGGEAVGGAALANLTGDIMKLSGLPNLWNKKMQLMIINVTESGVPKKLILNVPFIVTDTKSAIDLRSSATGSSQEARNVAIRNIDVVVRNGAQLDVTTAKDNATACTFNNLYIYPGGKVNISDNNLNVRNVYLRGGFSWLDATPDFRLPQMLVASGKSLVGISGSGNGVYYDLTADNEIYYMIALPKDVLLNDVTNEEGTRKFKAWIKRYDGARRVNDPHGNDWVGDVTTIQRGIGYEIAIRPSNSRRYGILRFPLLKGTAWQGESDATPPVTAHGIERYNANPPTVTANNVGWNLMGNPFFCALKGNNVNIEPRGLKQHLTNGTWDGTYEWDDGEVKYFTIPNKADYDYTDVRAEDEKLDAFYPFFVQVTTTAANPTLNFSTNENRALKAKRKSPYLSNQTEELKLDFTLSSEYGLNDMMGVNIDFEYSARFDLEDKEKTLVPGHDKLKIYTLSDGYRIAFNSLPDSSLTALPVGFIAAEGGWMTLSLKQMSDLRDIEHIILIDTEERLEWDMIRDSYEFYTPAAPEGNDTRFILSVKKKVKDIGTAVNNIGNLAHVTAIGYDGAIVIYGLSSKARVWLYDMTGKLIHQTANKDSKLTIDNLPTGVYNLRIVTDNEAITLRTIVR